MEVVLMDDAVVIGEGFDEGPDLYDVFRPVILNLPRAVLRMHMNRTCLAILEFLAWHGTKIDGKTGELVIRPLIISQDFFSHRFGVTRPWVGKMIRRLENLGYIKVYRRRDNQGKYLANVYVISERILNKSLIKILKSGKLKEECDKLQNLDLNSWILAIPEGITEIPPAPEFRNEETFREFFKAIYLRVKEGKMNLDDFFKFLMEIFEFKKKNQSKKEVRDICYVAEEKEEEDGENEREEMSEIDLDLYCEPEDNPGHSDRVNQHYSDSSLDDFYEEDPEEIEEMENRLLRYDYIISGYQELEDKVYEDLGSRRYIIFDGDDELENPTSGKEKKDDSYICPVMKAYSIDTYAVFYCGSGKNRRLCICAPEREFRKAIFRAKEMAPLKCLYMYLKSRKIPIVSDIEIAEEFHISMRRARYLLYLIGAEPLWAYHSDRAFQWEYNISDIENPWSPYFGLDWLVERCKRSDKNSSTRSQFSSHSDNAVRSVTDIGGFN